MHSLANVQEHFVQSLLNDTEIVAYSHINENKLNAKQCLQIYRNNILSSLLRRLQNIYPTVQKIVGEDYFKFLIKNYHHTKLNNFYRFLAEFVPLQKLPYLPDIARVEWAQYESFIARDYKPLELEKLKNIIENNYATLKAKLNPAAQLFSSQFPILEIFRLAQEKYIKKHVFIDLSTSADKLLVCRKNYEVYIEKLSAGEFVLLSAIKNNLSLKKSCGVALAAEPTLNIEFYLSKHFINQTIVELI